MLMIAFAFLSTLIQLAGAYVRFLPFREAMPCEDRKRLWRWLFRWGLLGFLVNLMVVQQAGLCMAAFKLVFFFGWIPYLLISVMAIKRPIEEHIFVLGMQAIWAFMIQSFAGMAVSLLYGAVTADRLVIHLLCNIAIFALLFPWARTMFTRLLRGPRPQDKTLRLCTAWLPFVIWLGMLLSVAKVTFLPEWSDRLTRLFIPPSFFFAYSMIAEAGREIHRRKTLAMACLNMEKQREELLRQTELLEETAERISVLRHDLRHSYRLVYALLSAGEEETALQHIRAQKEEFSNSGKK